MSSPRLRRRSTTPSPTASLSCSSRGTYNENVPVSNLGTALIGEDRANTVIDGGTSGRAAVRWEGFNIIVERLKLKTDPSSGGQAVDYATGSAGTIRDNLVNEAGTKGILAQLDKPVIEKNEVRACGSDEIRLADSSVNCSVDANIVQGSIVDVDSAGDNNSICDSNVTY